MNRLVTNNPSLIGPWVVARAGGVFCIGGDYAIGVIDDSGTVLGGVVYSSYYFRSVAIHMAIEDRSCVTRKTLKTIFEYPFNQLKVEKLIGYVQEDNQASRSLTERLGFTYETRIKDACVGGDLLVYSMVRARCKFLGG